jgi:hypothetical protein
VLLASPKEAKRQNFSREKAQKAQKFQTSEIFSRRLWSQTWIFQCLETSRGGLLPEAFPPCSVPEEKEGCIKQE